MTFHKYGVVAAVALLCGWAQAAVVINEVCYDNSSLADETGDKTSDWIELYNSGPAAVNLYNYGIGDKSGYEEDKGVRLPSYVFPAGGYLVVFASSTIAEHMAWTNAPDVALIPTNSAWRYWVAASAPAATWKTNSFDDAAWPTGPSPLGYNDPKQNMDCATALGYGGNRSARYVTTYFRKAVFVPNATNVTGLVMNARVNDGMAVYLNGREVLRYNLPTGTLANSTLASSALASTQWTSALLATNSLLQGTNVVAVEVHQASAASDDLVLDLNLTALVNAQVPIVHGGFGLKKEGEAVHLFNNALSLLQSVEVPTYEPGENKSNGTFTDGNTSLPYRMYAKPTPGRSNATYAPVYSELPTLPKPRFSLAPGMYAASQTVTLTSLTNTYTILYTTDGSDPRTSATALNVSSGTSVTVSNLPPASSGLAWIRTNPPEISNTVASAAWLPPSGSVGRALVLRAVAVSSGGKYCTPEASGTYFVGPTFTNRTLPVVSLIANTNDLFGFTSGLFVPGKTYADSPDGYGTNKWGKPHANYHLDSETQEWERPVRFELFESNQTAAAVSVPLGLTMHGGGTRAIPQKTLYLLAREAEYGTSRVDYALFPGEPTTFYKRFLLRNSGNDWYGPDTGVATMMKDAAFHRIVKNLNLSVMAYRPSVAYVNGTYWGLHNLRESFDKHYLASRYALDADKCDLLMHEEDPIDNDKVNIVRIDGDKSADEDYELLLNWVAAYELRATPNYQYFQTQVDVTNLTDYIIAETFFGNTDWPINNCDFWRSHTNQVAVAGVYGDTRWRWMLYDLDVAGERGSGYNMFDYLSDTDMTGRSEPAFLINKLWENTEYRALFASRYADLLNTTFRPERMADVISKAAASIASEIETHFRRWGRTFTQAQWQQSVNTALVQYTSERSSASWGHLDSHFSLGGTGQITVRNKQASGAGGRFAVNGVAIDTATEGVTNRAAWTGTYFRSLAVSVQAVPDAGYVFDGWVGSPSTSATRSLFVEASPKTVVARFRLAAAPAYAASGYEQWQMANYTEQEIVDGAAVLPSAPSGCAGLSNFELYAFGMSRTDGLTDAQRLARASLSLNNHSNALWVGYTRLNSSFSDVRYTLKITPGLQAPVVWSNAVTGVDLDPMALTNTLDASTWFYEVRLPAASPARDARFFKLEASQP